MGTLPTRNNIASIGLTKGQVRTALGDMRDFIADAMGTAGYAYLLNPTILGAPAVGIGSSMYAPGTTCQIAGGLSVWANSATSADPGPGSAYFYYTLFFPNITRQKIIMYGGYEIGVQPSTFYFRTGTNFCWYLGGTYSDTTQTPGSGGSTLMTLRNDGLYFKSGTVYNTLQHGTLARADIDQAFAGFVWAGGGFHMQAGTMYIGNPGVPSQQLFNYGDLGIRIKMYGNNEAFSMGIQPSTFFLRTAGVFCVYNNGTYNATQADPGGGSRLLYIDEGSILFKTARIHHDGLNGHGNYIDADSVDGYHASSFMIKSSTNRPGVVVWYRYDADVGQMGRMAWDGARMRFYAWDGGATGFETAVNYCDTAGNSLACSGTANYANYATGGGNIVTRAYGRADFNGPNTVYNSSAQDGIYMYAANEGGYFKWFTSSGHATRIQYADYAFSAGNASTATTATNASYAATVGTVQLNNIHRAYGSVTMNAGNISVAGNDSAGVFDVPYGCFGSPVMTVDENKNYRCCPVALGGNSAQRRWQLFTNGNDVDYVNVVSYDYITNSGDPHLWVSYDELGNIQAVWEAEDPVNEEFPNLSPLPFTNAIKVKIPTIGYLQPLYDRVTQTYNMPDWAEDSIYSGAENPDELVRLMIKAQANMRSYEMTMVTPDMDLREFVLDQTDDFAKRDWRVQMILRSLNRVYTGKPVNSMTTIIQKAFKVDPKRAILDLR